MENEFENEVKQKTDSQIKEIVVNFQNYRGLLAEAARKELRSRGIELTEDEKKIIEATKNRRKQTAIELQEESTKRQNNDYQRNVVDNEDAPELYSVRVLTAFSALFSVLFGGIMMAMNLKRIKADKGIIPVLLFSFAYTAFVIAFVNWFKLRGIGTSLNIVGSVFLTKLYWKKYIGEELKYRSRAFWIPAIIGVALVGLILLAVISGQN